MSLVGLKASIIGVSLVLETIPIVWALFELAGVGLRVFLSESNEEEEGLSELGLETCFAVLLFA